MIRSALPLGLAAAALLAPLPLVALDRIVALEPFPAVGERPSHLVLRQSDDPARLDVSLLVPAAEGAMHVRSYPGFLPANAAEPAEIEVTGADGLLLRHHLLAESGYAGHVEFTLVPEWLGAAEGGPPELQLTVLALAVSARSRADADRWIACAVDYETGLVEIAFREGAEGRRDSASAQVEADPPDLADLSADVAQADCAGIPF